jgi:uncharacterized protein (TIGR03435 family)
MTSLLLLVFVAASQVQPPPAGAPLTFEVASIRVATSEMNGVRGGCRGIDTVVDLKRFDSPPPLGRCVITDARLSHLIGIAFDVSMQGLKTGPDWMQRGDLRFDVQAKAEDPTKTTEKQLLTMLQNLLVERFQLKFHYETKEEPGFALIVAKNGPKLHRSTSDETTISFRGPKGESSMKPMGGPMMALTARKYSMPMLANMLTFVGSHGPGADKTNLKGEYDFTLSWDEDGGPVLSTALRQQLGLDIRAEKIPVSTFVVDSAQKPSGN